MGSRHLDPFSAAGARRGQVQAAHEMQEIVAARTARLGTKAPPYDFLELIGKGSFGRVYKCRHRETRKLMAVKIIDVDEMDATLEHSRRGEAVEDFVKEVNALKQIKDSGARNINQIYEAFDLHSQLWIVSEYCSGGSVHTLMKSRMEPGLEESFIIPIARELAIALKSVHDAGIVHRDIKCGNVLIDERGNLQLCDFGIAANMESETSKRSTIIGTPYWMPPEMHQDQQYGRDIDCWAYGCTIYEMATGMPPYHKFHPMYLKEVLKSAPRLEDDGKYSQGLRDFVAHILQEKPTDRPTASQILNHDYIRNSEVDYPTHSLQSLIDRYVLWERKGGQRLSLFTEHGAAAPQLGAKQDDDDHWIFSTTDDFDQGYEQRQSMIFGGGIAEMDFAERTPTNAGAINGLPHNLTPLERAQEELRAQRGEESLNRLFNASTGPYDYEGAKVEALEQPLSDLPLRNMSDGRAANRETLIDLDTSGLDMPKAFNFEFSDITTVKANRKSSLMSDSGDSDHQHGSLTKRATKDWKFPTFDYDGPEMSHAPKLSVTVEEYVDDHNQMSSDWRFPGTGHTAKNSLDNENRRTMDWTFSNAGPITEPESDPEPGLASRPMLDEPFKPSLLRMATEPPLTASDIDQPRHLSIDRAFAGDRESRAMIDLDSANEYQPSFNFDQHINGGGQNRSVSPISMSQSMTSMGPFDLDSEASMKGSGMQRWPHRRMPSSNGSMSVAERRMSRLQRPSKSSFGSHLSTNRSRGASVDSTASSIPDDGSDDSVFGRQYNRSMNAKMRDQLRTGLQRTASSMGNRHSRDLTDESYGDADTDGPYLNDPQHRLQSSVIIYDTDSSVQEDQRYTRAPPAFPPITIPQSAILLEDAEHAMLLSEFEKMLDTASEALLYTEKVLKDREMELDSAAPDGHTSAGHFASLSDEQQA